MSKVCHECHGYVNNPFYTSSVVICGEDNRPKVVSDLDIALCDIDFNKIPQDKKLDLIPNNGTKVYFGITLALGGVSMFGTVSRVGPTSHIDGFEAIIHPNVIKDVLPKSYELLERTEFEDRWIEVLDGRFGNELIERPYKERFLLELIH